MKKSTNYLINNSPWPILTSISMMITMSELFSFMNYLNKSMMGMALTLMSTSQWMRDVKRESLYQGNHNKTIQKLTKINMLMMLTSELFLFTSLFWMFLMEASSPSVNLGSIWPPKGIHPINPMSMPSMNTIILLTSGVSITWSHHNMKSMKKNKQIPMVTTILLGLMFMMCMMNEYKNSQFSMSSSCYGSLFFMITGFHGLHVMMGMLLLTISMYQMKMKTLSNNHMVFIELSIWYWHFVDVIWLMVYTFLYWMNIYLKTNSL